MDNQAAVLNEKNNPTEIGNFDLGNENGQKLNQIPPNPFNSQENIENSSISTNNGKDLKQSNSKSNLLQNTPSSTDLFEKQAINPDKELLRQIEKEKKNQDKTNQIMIDLIDLGFSKDSVQEALQQTNFCPELAFDILYEREKKNADKGNKVKYNYSEIYNNYEEKDQKYIDSIVKDHGLTLDDAVEAFESCNKDISSTDQLIELLK